ncbi:MAG: hypothetical protein ABSD74_03435 [Rhizomicrobium sp.]|jgi:hypothetical protein
MRRVGLAVVVLTAVMGATLFSVGALTILAMPVHMAGARGTPLDIVMGLTQLCLYVAVRIGAPQFIALRWLRMGGRMTRLGVGALSGWFFVLVTFAQAKAQMLAARPAGDALGAFAVQIFWHFPSFVAAFFGVVNIEYLVFFMILGTVIGYFLWGPFYRLPGDHSRDWDARVLGGRPPYAS